MSRAIEDISEYVRGELRHLRRMAASSDERIAKATAELADAERAKQRYAAAEKEFVHAAAHLGLDLAEPVES